MRFMPTGHFLFFASPKKSKQKKGDPDVQVWLRQTSLTAHPFFGACELAALCASSDKRMLVPEKRILRSAGRRGGAVASNICDGLGSLKFNLSRFSKKPHGRTPSGFVFSGCLILQRQPENLNDGLGDEPSPFHCGRVSGSLKRLFECGLNFVSGCLITLLCLRPSHGGGDSGFGLRAVFPAA